MSDSSQPAPQWSLPARVAFRFSFVYLMSYILMNGNATVFQAIPGVGFWIANLLARPSRALALWIGTNCFHLTGVPTKWHGGGSGDTALHYVQILCFAGTALFATAIWSALDRRRPHYQTLFAWLRFLLRLTVGLGMLFYGFGKIFPLQMREPSQAILSNTYGNSSPMTLLWTLIGLNPGYEVVCGAAEVAGGLLILFRRTAALGALLSAVVMFNVVLFNFFFDVPVKLYASHLLLMCFFLLLPDLRALWNFFMLHQPAELTGVWIPPASRKSFRIATRVVEVFFLCGVSIGMMFFMGHNWRQHLAALSPTPITGAWQVDSIETANPKAGPLSPEGLPWIALYIDDQRQGFYRSSDGQLWRCGFKYDEAKHLLAIRSVAGKPANYTWTITDPDHLMLSRVVAEQTVAISFHRLPASDHCPLTDRGFHWINEWGYER